MPSLIYKFLPLTLSLFLWGCSTPTPAPYVEPFKNQHTATIYFAKYRQSQIYFSDFPLLCTSPKAVHSMASFKETGGTQVPADRLLTFRYQYIINDGSYMLKCNEFVASFVPKAGHTYGTEISFDSQAKLCYLHLYELSTDQFGFNKKPLAYLKRTYTSKPKGFSGLGIGVSDIQCTDGAELLPWLTKNHYTY